MQSFRDYALLSEEYSQGVPVVTMQPDASNPNDKRLRSDINADLADITSISYSWPQAGIEEIADTLWQHGLVMAGEATPNEDTDEIVYGIEGTEPQLFLYIFYEPTDNGKSEFYAEIVNEAELHELLDEIDVGENDNNNDDDDNDDNDGNSEEEDVREFKS